MASNKNLLDKLPYELTKGVTATREGLEFHVNDVRWMLLEADEYEVYSDETGRVIVFWDNTKHLRYQEGEWWCEDNMNGELRCGISEPVTTKPLARVVSMLVDDAKAFQILHACIEEFGDG